MKAIILLAVCILCGESKLESEFTGASSPALHSLIGTVVRRERQVGVCSDEELNMRLDTAGCDPNIGQRLVDIYLDCGNYAFYARSFVGGCSRNENGRFCSEFQRDYIQFEKYTNPLQSNCPSLNSYSNYVCTDLCRAALQSLKSNIGCCLNSLYNISDYDRDFQLFNKAGLWSACSVSPPSYCQATNLLLHSLTTSHNCSGLEILEQIYKQIYCDAQVFQPYLDVLSQCESTQYQFYISGCGLSENNQFCGLLINNSYPRAVQSQCQDYTQGCTSSCQTAINTFKKAMGCCVNFYNGSEYHSTIDPALWSACGISTPGFCPSTLISETNSAFSYDLPKISMILLLSVLLNMHV